MSKLLLKRSQEVADEIRRKKPAPIVREAFSSGSTLLNLALSDNTEFGFIPGTIVNIIGDSAAGKTFLLWSIFAELAHDKRFEQYKLYYDEPEVSLEFDLSKLFGDKTKKRVDRSFLSNTIEDWHDNVMKLAEKDQPAFVYGLDSFDALTAEAELKKDIRDGSYGTAKAKLSGEVLRKVVRKLESTDSMIFIISQTRDNIGVTFGSKKTRSGGKALKFYSTHEMWLAVEGHVKRKGRDVGVDVICKVSKNKLTGKLRTVGFPILYDYGIDDVTSMTNWLLEEKVWKIEGRRINTNDFAQPMTMEKLIDYILEEKGKEEELKQIVSEKWKEIEQAIATKRPSRY